LAGLLCKLGEKLFNGTKTAQGEIRFREMRRYLDEHCRRVLASVSDVSIERSVDAIDNL
jgi:hypothetical protein